MPHAALLVVQAITPMGNQRTTKVSMPHAALLVVQAQPVREEAAKAIVSMPHAALLVVQVHRSQPLSLLRKNALLESLRMFELSNGKT